MEDYGLSLLDVVKHAVKTVIRGLDKNDRFSLVSFHSTAEVELELLEMNEAGKKKAETITMGLRPLDCTNLWDGLKFGMEVMRKRKEQNRLAACLLLTDGQPNVEPPGGHLNAFRKYKDQHQFLSCFLNTFGFGYGINSDLLTELSEEGSGIYNFIPDSGFVGTAFVNTLSNLLSTFAHKTQVLVEPAEGCALEKNVRGVTQQVTSWGTTITIGSVQYGQSRDVVFTLNVPKEILEKGTDFVTVTLKYETHEGEKKSAEAEGGAKIGYDAGVEEHMTRLAGASLLFDSAKTDSDRTALTQKVSKFLDAAKKARDVSKNTTELMKDFDGQVVEALSKAAFYTKWGRHYLPSLMMAHLNQQCTNFKDPGLQVYGGDVFAEIQDAMDAIFLAIPPPQPSRAKTTGPNKTKTVASMATYYSNRNPCFSGRCEATMADGSKMRLDAIRKGDSVLVSSESGETATVQCVVRTLVEGGSLKMVELSAEGSKSSLQVTEYHPVRIGGKWHYPCDLADAKEIPCDEIFSFVLESGHVMLIEGIECVGLGHNFVDDVVVAHPYFGSQRIVEDLKKVEGWNAGMITFQSRPFLYNPNTELIEGVVRIAVSADPVPIPTPVL